MDSKLALFSLSRLEKGRVIEPGPNPTQIESFRTIEEMISRSLMLAKPIQPQPELPPAKPFHPVKTVDRPFLDETLLQKLLQFKSQIPLSSRIIRATDS